MSEKFALMHAEKATFALAFMARLLDVSLSGYHAWVQRGDTPSPRALRRAALTERVTQLHEASHGTSGFRRVLAALHADGVSASAGLVRSIMAQLGIFGVQPRSKKRTTIPAHDAHTRPDLVRRDFTAAEPATRLVGDITYLRTGEGWLYLATVIDLHSRMVVGWSMADHMRTELADSGRGLRRATTLTPTARCCNDRLNSPSTPRPPTPPSSRNSVASGSRSGGAGHVMTTLWRSRGSRC